MTVEQMMKGRLRECIESMIKPSDKNDCDERPIRECVVSTYVNKYIDHHTFEIAF